MKMSRDAIDLRFALLVNPLPSEVRSKLLLDEGFCANFGIEPQFWFPLNDVSSVTSDSLHQALRGAIAGKKSAFLKTQSGPDIRAELGMGDEGQATLVIDQKGFAFSDADLLSDERDTRIKALTRVFAAKPLRGDEEEKWLAIAGERALTDREYVTLKTALAATPEAIKTQLRAAQELDVDSLMPDEPDYFGRLIAPLSDSRDLETFNRSELATARKSLVERQPKRALRRIAFAALWQPLIPFEILASIGSSDISSLLEANDPFSLLCGFELCRQLLQSDPAFVELGTSFLNKLLVDPIATTDRCNIFCAMTLVSTINLRRVARASNAPVFWVRLAALAHAGVLTNALYDLPSSEDFLNWATEKFSSTYLWHGVIDRRDAPRWRPEWISPDHLFAELVGRALGALATIPATERPPTWVAAIEAAVARLEESKKVIAAYFPGPFDDFREYPLVSSQMDVFNDVESNLEAAWALDEVPGVVALANTAQPSQRFIANVLRILNQPVDEPIAKVDELSFLGLGAHVSAISRSEPIAEAVINRCIFLARNSEPATAPSDLFMIMAEACAAHADPQKHRELLGATATKLCFAINDSQALSGIGSILDVLGRRDERLIPALSRARAIIRAKLAVDPRKLS
ncbi:hypothetical protein LB515_24360 [Mesorhizobium sp. CA15]|uniref:hypothetical protein n=1 Tax=Mesorhizobium sp. CA15 TaxID=2876641 RepID=UPI001CD08D00|nr:hypothetical protein [Mesorhizobium sp. CA15]MBZ9868517.1 hypothetical protein [Mesorhizobium sp. CA15]